MPNELSLENLPLLKSSHVHMKDEARVMKLINKIVEGGKDKLQIVTDFDRTITKQHVNGKEVLSSFGIFGKCKQLPPSYTDEAKRLYHKYRPIEVDPNLPLEDKIKAMEDWMIAVQKLIRGLPFDPKELDEVVKIYGTAIRDDTKLLIEKLHKAKVPVLVFSAGLGDVVEAVLRHHGVLMDNVKVISNFLKYNGKELDGFKADMLIHVFNKNEHTVEDDYFQILKGRHNVLLMGDSTGDATMADGLKDTGVVLKIGFLHEHEEESLPGFMDAFDIVLIDDQTMDITLDILKPIL